MGNIKYDELSIPELQEVYENCCEAYRKRICEMWDLPYNDSWWVADIIGGSLALNDMQYILSMDDLKLLVELNVTLEEYQDYYTATLSTTRINVYSWFVRKYRP